MNEARTYLMRCEKSPAVVFRPLALEQVHIDGYLGKYLKRAVEVTIPSQYELLESTGRIDNFRRASGKIDKDFQGYFFNDSDVYKWVEGCSYALLYAEPIHREKLEKILDGVIDEIVAAQDEDGYLNTYFTFERAKDRWTDLANMHELYCAGHLIQAAIAHRRVTGKSKLFDAALKLANHINNVFGFGKKRGTCGHPEIEMALVELFREVEDPEFLHLARYFIMERGHGFAGGKEYTIDHKPFLELTEMVGHAVRMIYLCCGAADFYLETANEDFFRTLTNLWENMTEKKLYITGGVGSRHEGEAFGEEYELPNRRAYAETCASIANFMWNWRMLLATGDAKFADTMEQILYNGLLSGISVDGKHYFYVNPLEDLGKHRRREWFNCACCPTNLARFLPSLPAYIYTASDDSVWIHIYERSNCELSLKGKSVQIRQRTDYPFDGRVEVVLNCDEPVFFDLMLRIPGWAHDVRIEVNGTETSFGLNRGYARIARLWSGINTVSLSMPLDVRLTQSHPYVRENVGKIAILRGPVLFCAEQIDNPNIDVWTFAVDPDEVFDAYTAHDPILGRTVFIKAKGTEGFKSFHLYEPHSRRKTLRSSEITLVPYHLWANREPGPMAVWLNVLE